jgi:hypothetical protein
MTAPEIDVAGIESADVIGNASAPPPPPVLPVGDPTALVEPVVSEKYRIIFGTVVPGKETAVAVTDKVSVVATSEVAVTVIDAAVVESDLALVEVPVAKVSVGATINVAFAGTELSTPIPNAATATSAMRLKFVFVDICFLSLVVTRNFLVAASR